MIKSYKLNHNLFIYSMSCILCLAGFAHFVFPEIFLPAMPPYLPVHLELIYLTGALELIFAIGIFIRKTRKISATLLMLYFIAILPAHIHVSINRIEMFGITNKFLLWTRTVFQSFFIYWAWRIKKLN